MNFISQTAPPSQVNNMGTSAKEMIDPVEQPEPVPKVPIPDEHLNIQKVFDNLRKQCAEATNNTNNLVRWCVMYIMIFENHN